MNEFLLSVINGTDLSKAVFLMVTGIGFVFAVQLIFYGVIRFFLRMGDKSGKTE